MIPVRTSDKPWIDWAERRLGRSLTTRSETAEHLLGDDGYPDVLPLPTGARILGWTEDAIGQHVTVHCDLDGVAVVYLKDLWVAETGTRGMARAASRSDILVAMRGQSVVYFIRGAGLTKIGTTVNLATRLGDLRVGSPVPLEVAWVTPGGLADELALHAKYATERRHGEWFCLSNDDLSDIIETYPPPRGLRLTKGVFSYECTCGVVYKHGGLAARRCHETHDEDAA